MARGPRPSWNGGDPTTAPQRSRAWTRQGTRWQEQQRRSAPATGALQYIRKRQDDRCWLCIRPARMSRSSTIDWWRPEERRGKGKTREESASSWLIPGDFWSCQGWQGNGRWNGRGRRSCRQGRRVDSEGSRGGGRARGAKLIAFLFFSSHFFVRGDSYLETRAQRTGEVDRFLSVLSFVVGLAWFSYVRLGDEGL
jgi:hypothetical protein